MSRLSKVQACLATIVALRGVDDAFVVADLVEQGGANREEPTLGIAVKNLGGQSAIGQSIRKPGWKNVDFIRLFEPTQPSQQLQIARGQGHVSLGRRHPRLRDR